jgi:hypothetical protein
MKPSILCILAAVMFVSIIQHASGTPLEGNLCLWGYYEGKKCPEVEGPPKSQKEVDEWRKEKGLKPINWLTNSFV